MGKSEVTIQGLRFIPLIDERKLAERVGQMAVQIQQAVAADDMLFVCMLGGAFVFASDLLRSMQTPAEIAFVKWSSYEGTASVGQIREELPLSVPVKDRHVVVVEDIVESGFTLSRFVQQVMGSGAKSCRIATLLHKPACQRYPLELSWVGFEIGSEFVVGYGLDYNGYGRMLPAIYQQIGDRS